MVTHAASRRAWTSATLDGPEAWHYQLPDVCRSVLDEHLKSLRSEPRPITQLTLSPSEREACAGELGDVLWALEEGRGFVILEGPAPPHCSAQEAQAVYWLLGQALGEPMEQNVQGTLLYDVRDTGQDVRYGARFSVTNAESSFHTDNSFGDLVLDYVGLLCLQSARSGGLSQLVSGQSVAEELRVRHPQAWEVLRRPFHVDRRGGLRAGETPTAHFPIVQGDEGTLLYRYLRFWIEAGHEKVGQPLTGEQVSALDTLDAVLEEPGLRAEFMLAPGEMLFINNRWLLHNRTAFEDHPEPLLRRHYVRLWLRRRES
jgi:alpha-ketoglutarate-dependent taurine dioxygenase